MEKRGLSSVVTNLILILLSIIALVSIGIVIKNFASEESEFITTEGLTLDVQILKVEILSDTEMTVLVKRNPGGNEISGVVFVVYDIHNSEVHRKNIPLEELQKKNFEITLTVLNTSTVSKITVAPIYKTDSGKEVIGNIRDEEKIRDPLPSAGGGGGSTGGNSNPSVDNCGNGVCEDYEDCLTCEIDCGVCYSCNDWIQNGDELGIDCGGSCPELCVSGCNDCVLEGDIWCQSSNIGDYCASSESNCTERNGLSITNCPTCYDGIRNQNEDDVDCGGPYCQPCIYCGDGICDLEEDCGTCPLDCGRCFDCEGLLAPPVCGDGICAGNAKGIGWVGPENTSNCPEDCIVGTCGDGICGPSESCNIHLDAGEIFTPCPEDCGDLSAVCGDGICGTDETCTNCQQDCGACSLFCGDGICDLNSYGNPDCETSNPFPSLGAFEHCPDEHPYCAQDCGICTFLCGNNYCDAGETYTGMNSFCGDCFGNFYCGDGICSPTTWGGGETSESCPADCGETCTPERGCNYDQVCNNGVCGGYRTSCDVFGITMDLDEYPYNKYGQRIVPEGKEVRFKYDYWGDQESSCDQDMWNFYICEYNLEDTSGWACDQVNYGILGTPTKYLNSDNTGTWIARMSDTCKPQHEVQQEFFVTKYDPSGMGPFSVSNLRSCTFDWDSGFAYIGTNTETMPPETDPRFFTIVPASCYNESFPQTCQQCVSSPDYHWCTHASVPDFCTDNVINCANYGGEIITTCPTCTDGIQNQGEIEIDCGGAYCEPCNYGTIYCTDSTNDCPFNPNTVYGFLDNLECIEGTCNKCDASTSGMACTSHEFPWQEGTCAMRPSDDYWICNRWREIVYDEENDVHLMSCRSDTVGYPCMSSAQGGGQFVQTGFCDEYGNCELDLTNFDSTHMENTIHILINQERTNNGLSALTLDSSLSNVARLHSQDMADNVYFSHINLEGLTPQDRANLAGYSCITGVGENIYRHNTIGETFYEIATSTVDGWMGSPGHREAILNPSFSTEGIGVVVSFDNRILITENFC